MNTKGLREIIENRLHTDDGRVNVRWLELTLLKLLDRVEKLEEEKRTTR